MTREELQSMAALHCHLAKKNGHVFDKKAMRVAAMADYMEIVATCGHVGPLAGLFEAVDMAIVVSPMNIPGVQFDRTLYRRMEVTG
jgi:hypothetical protein